MSHHITLYPSPQPNTSQFTHLIKKTITHSLSTPSPTHLGKPKAKFDTRSLIALKHHHAGDQLSLTVSHVKKRTNCLIQLQNTSSLLPYLYTEHPVLSTYLTRMQKYNSSHTSPLHVRTLHKSTHLYKRIDIHPRSPGALVKTGAKIEEKGRTPAGVSARRSNTHSPIFRPYLTSFYLTIRHLRFFRSSSLERWFLCIERPVRACASKRGQDLSFES